MPAKELPAGWLNTLSNPMKRTAAMPDPLAPAPAALACRFPELLPEPQLVTLHDELVLRPLVVCRGGIAPEAAPLAEELLSPKSHGDFRVSVALDPSFRIPEAREAAQAEGYALAIRPGEARVTAAGLAGARWGLQSLRQLLAAWPAEGGPAADLLDWPAMRTRGIFMENKWGPDLMTLEDWRGVVDYLADRKLNKLGIGLYGCWCVQYDGQTTEFLMTPVPGHPELQTPKTVRWYSPAEGKWQERHYLPTIFEQGFLGEVVAYGRSRGVTVLPYVNSLGHNTLVPRHLPELASKDEQGRPRGFGYCLTNPAVVEFVAGWYEQLYRQYFAPHGVHTFHIQMDEVWDEFCRCPECTAQPRETLLQEYVVALVKRLVAAGVQDVVVYNDQLARHMAALDERFIGRLREEGVFEHVIVDWWGYDNHEIDERNHPKLGLGLRSWVKPMTCYFNWSRYQPHHGNIALMLAMGHAEGAEGAASYSVFDPAWAFDFDLLAEYAWNARGAGPVHRFGAKWAALRGGDTLLEALQTLDRAAEMPVMGSLYYYGYTYPRADRPYPRPYPAEALPAVAGRGEELQAAARAATRVRSLLAGVAGEPAGNLRAEAARIEAYALVFDQLRIVQEAAAEYARAGEAGVGDVGRLLDLVDEARRSLLTGMAAVEEHKPAYLAPFYLRDLSVLYELLEQLRADLIEAGEGRRPWAEVRWHVAVPCTQRGCPAA